MVENVYWFQQPGMKMKTCCRISYMPESIPSTVTHFTVHTESSREQQSLTRAWHFSSGMEYSKGAEDLKLTRVELHFHNLNLREIQVE